MEFIKTSAVASIEMVGASRIRVCSIDGDIYSGNIEKVNNQHVLSWDDMLTNFEINYIRRLSVNTAMLKSTEDQMNRATRFFEIRYLRNIQDQVLRVELKENRAFSDIRGLVPGECGGMEVVKWREAETNPSSSVRTGLKIGDIIIAVDKRPIGRLGSEEAAKTIANSSLKTLIIVRPSAATPGPRFHDDDTPFRTVEKRVSGSGNSVAHYIIKDQQAGHQHEQRISKEGSKLCQVEQSSSSTTGTGTSKAGTMTRGVQGVVEVVRIPSPRIIMKIQSPNSSHNSSVSDDGGSDKNASAARDMIDIDDDMITSSSRRATATPATSSAVTDSLHVPVSKLVQTNTLQHADKEHNIGTQEGTGMSATSDSHSVVNKHDDITSSSSSSSSAAKEKECHDKATEITGVDKGWMDGKWMVDKSTTTLAAPFDPYTEELSQHVSGSRLGTNADADTMIGYRSRFQGGNSSSSSSGGDKMANGDDGNKYSARTGSRSSSESTTAEEPKEESGDGVFPSSSTLYAAAGVFAAVTTASTATSTITAVRTAATNALPPAGDEDVGHNTAGDDDSDGIKYTWHKIKSSYFDIPKRPCYAIGKRIDAEPLYRKYTKKVNALDDIFHTDEMRISIMRTKNRMYTMHADPDLRWTALSAAAREYADPYSIGRPPN